MSSHHIIREDQEPALFIMNTEATDKEQINQLLEWSPTVIVSEQALNEVLSWGIKVDVVLALTDHISELAIFLRDQFPLKIISSTSSEEILSTGLYFLIARKQKAVNIISNEPLESFEPFQALDISVFRLGSRWSLIRSGHFEKWLPIGRTVKTFPGQDVFKTEVDGVVVIRKESPFWISEE